MAKLGELTLKGANIKQFEKKLLQNARSYFGGDEQVKISLRAGRMYFTADESYSQKIEYCLEHLVGITGWAKTQVVEKNIDAIKDIVYKLCVEAAQNGSKTFKCEARRADKSFPYDSYQINKEAAARVFDQKVLLVDVHKPDIKVFIEVRDVVYVYTDDKKGIRGLPVGVSGSGLLLLSGGIDSPVAGWRMMRRGMKVDAVYYHSYPYTSDEAQKKVEDLAARISAYGVSVHLHIVSFTEAQMQIKKSSPEAWSTLLLRMCMMSVANKIAERIGAQCIITGESLGQVASQTVENMAVTESMAAYPLIRPLVGMDKEEIIADALTIGTYDTSILPYEDCCVLFSPKHPVLKADKEEAKKIYDAMQIEPLLEEAFEKREIKRFWNGALQS